MKYRFLVLFLWLWNYGYSQKPVIVFDLKTGKVDTLPVVAYDPTVMADSTNHYVGSYNASIEMLEQVAPTQNLYQGSNFTLKKRAVLDYELSNYPIRTSVKLSFIKNGMLNDNCSGSLISSRHVLTAAHCVASRNELSHDSLMVHPVFDQGIPSPNFEGSSVRRVYIFKDWEIVKGEDIAILELEKNIGDKTGWLGIGFHQVDSLMYKDIYYKFSYPIRGFYPKDSLRYNGDTLYYNYGKIDLVNSEFLGAFRMFGDSGESGSSLIKVVNDKVYISYGVLSLATDLKHSRIRNWQFYAIKEILERNIVTHLNEDMGGVLQIYPNPVKDILYIRNTTNDRVITCYLYDSLGRLVSRISDSREVNLSRFPAGVYYLTVKTQRAMYSEAVIKK